MKFHLGAGTFISVLLALAIGGYGLYQQRRSTTQPLVVERVVQGTAAAGIAPVPEFLLRHQAELALSSAQSQHIQRLATAYRKDIAPRQQEMTTVAAAYKQTMERTPQQAHLTSGKLKQRGAASNTCRVCW